MERPGPGPRTALAYLLAFLSIGAMHVTAQGIQSPADHQAAHRDLAAARLRWSTHRPHAYEFVLSIPNGADVWGRRFPAYQVTGSASATLMAPTGGSATIFSGRNSIDALFDLIEQQLDAAAGRVFLAFDEELGYPTDASFDATSFRVAAFRAIARAGEAIEPFALIEHVNHCAFFMPDPTDLSVCPTYAIAMWGDGLVTYNGGSGVRTIGRRQHRVDAQSIRDLTHAIATSDFFALADHYSAMPGERGMEMTIDHAAEQWVTIRRNGVQKTVRDFYGAPAALRDLERAIERATDSYRYTGRESGR